MSALAAPADPPFTAADFAEISRVVSDVAGIQLRAGKEGLVHSRLARRVRDLGLGSYDAYLARTRGPAGAAELAHMVDLLTTNKTSFFREAAHFALLRDAVAPAFGAARGGLRLWSAGCSSGEEPYTLTMVLRDALGAGEYSAARVLATDLSARVLARARAAVYTDEQASGVPEALRARHLARADVGGSPGWAVRAEVRAPVRFASLNLLGPWPMGGPFHAIFCRNVMIYFDKPTQAALVQRFAALLAPGGYLCVGHSESLSGIDHGLAYVQPATYRRPA